MSEVNYGIDADVSPNLDVEEIENDHMYLLSVVQDTSGSMGDYTMDMNKAIKAFVKSIQDSKQDDEMLVSLTEFNSTITSSGFQNVADMNTNFSTSGWTKLYDAIILAAQQLTDYKQALIGTGVRARGGLVIFSDGHDNESKKSVSDAAKVIKQLKQDEVIVAFIAFGAEARGIADNLGIEKEYVLETDATPSELRRIWGILSKSAISSSKSAAAGASQTSFFDV